MTDNKKYITNNEDLIDINSVKSTSKEIETDSYNNNNISQFKKKSRFSPLQKLIFLIFFIVVFVAITIICVCVLNKAKNKKTDSVSPSGTPTDDMKLKDESNNLNKQQPNVTNQPINPEINQNQIQNIQPDDTINSNIKIIENPDDEKQSEGDEVTDEKQPQGDEVTDEKQPQGDEVTDKKQPQGDEVTDEKQPQGGVIGYVKSAASSVAGTALNAGKACCNYIGKGFNYIIRGNSTNDDTNTSDIK